MGACLVLILLPLPPWGPPSLRSVAQAGVCMILSVPAACRPGKDINKTATS